MGSAVIIQMTLLRGREKQRQYFLCVERTIKEKQIRLCGLINSSTHTARRMNILHIAQLGFFFSSPQARNGGKELWFLLFLCSDSLLGDMAGLKWICQNLTCDIERRSLEYVKDRGRDLYLFSISGLKWNIERGFRNY